MKNIFIIIIVFTLIGCNDNMSKNMPEDISTDNITKYKHYRRICLNGVQYWREIGQYVSAPVIDNKTLKFKRCKNKKK